MKELTPTDEWTTPQAFAIGTIMGTMSRAIDEYRTLTPPEGWDTYDERMYVSRVIEQEMFRSFLPGDTNPFLQYGIVDHAGDIWTHHYDREVDAIRAAGGRDIVSRYVGPWC